MVSELNRGERGASEVVGVVLLFGMVVVASLVVILTGASGLEAVQGQTDEKQAETVLQEFDSRISSLTASEDTAEARFDLRETNPSWFSVSSGNWMNVSINRNESCAADIRMSSANYDDGSVEVGYQAGGVWNRFSANNSTMVSEPAVVYRDGSIEMDIANITGRLDKTENELVVTDSSVPSDTIARGDCVRPDNVTIAVQSRYYQAWGRYLETEFAASVTTHHSNQTAVLYLSQSELPERVNDSANNVVVLTDSNRHPKEGITFDKGAENRYTVSATPLTDGTLDVGNVTSIDSAANVTRPPIDVMFVIDESGSMRNDDSDGTTRSEEAQSASRKFVGDLNASRDRAGVVSYESNSRYRLTSDSRYLTGDFSMSGVNASIEAIPDYPYGGTNLATGIRRANTVIELQSNGTRNRAIVALTDGVNNGCGPNSGNDVTNNDDPYDCQNNRDTIDRANQSAANGVTIYTVGYGDDDDIDEALLEEVADQTGGSYYQATSASQLESVFEDIQRRIASTQMIARSPISSKYSTGTGQVYAPQAAGQLDEFAQYNIGGTEFTNINDPTAESRFSHSFSVTDGESVDFRAYDFECADDGWVGTGRYRRHNNSSYQVIRCTDIADDTETVKPDGIYLDGDNIASLMTAETAWWQDDINASFAARSDICVNRGGTSCGDSFGELDLKSNQALVHFDLADGAKSNNRLLMLYEIGIAESNADAADVINIEVNEVKADS